MPRQTWLADVVADEFRNSKGFRVDVYPGWETRGNALFTPTHVMDHHTGAGAYNNLLRYMAEGPVHPPLCNIATSRPFSSGGIDVVRITIVAAGRANHAGLGSFRTIPQNSGNRYSIGIENQNNGSQSWPAQQLEAMRRLDAALLMRLGRSVDFLLDHKTYAPRRKIDRHTINVENERRIVARIIEQRTRRQDDPWEVFYMSLNDEEKQVLKDLAEYLTSEDGTRGDSFARQTLRFLREDSGRLREYLEAIDHMGSSPRGQGRAVSALWREAVARGWDTSFSKFRENRRYSPDEIENRDTI